MSIDSNCGIALCTDKYISNIFHAHIESKLIDDIAVLIDTLYRETGSSVYLEVLLLNSGESYQLFRGAGYDADREIRKDYPGRTPLCLLQRYQKDYRPTANTDARKALAEAMPKRKKSELELKRKQVRDIMIQLVRDGAGSLAQRSYVPAAALQRNNVCLNGFQRDPVLIPEKYHWSNVENYTISESIRFLEAHDSGGLNIQM